MCFASLGAMRLLCIAPYVYVPRLPYLRLVFSVFGREISIRESVGHILTVFSFSFTHMLLISAAFWNRSGEGTRLDLIQFIEVEIKCMFE